MRPADVLDLQAVADLLGIKKETAKQYRHHGELPEPAGFVSGAPWWPRQAIVAWQKNRPKAGQR